MSKLFQPVLTEDNTKVTKEAGQLIIDTKNKKVFVDETDANRVEMYADAASASVVDELQQRMATAESDINAKADKSDLATTNETLNNFKVTQENKNTALETELATKANQTELKKTNDNLTTLGKNLETTNEELAKKANSEDVETKFEEERNNSNTKYTNALITTDNRNKVIQINDLSPIEEKITVQLKDDTITDFSSNKVTVFGKNLGYCILQPKVIGLVLSEDSNGNFRYTGTLNNSYSYAVGLPQSTPCFIPKGTTIVTNSFFEILKVNTDGSKTIVDNDGASIGFVLYDSEKSFISGTQYQARSNTPLTIVLSKDCYYLSVLIRFSPQSGITTGDTIEINNIRLQLEIGETATEYEKPKEPVIYTSSANGLIKNIIGYSNGITNIISTVNMEYKYNTDINKKFKKYSNLLVKNKNDSKIIISDDISPVNNELNIFLSRQKNLIRYPYNFKTLTVNGVTATTNDNHSILIDGINNGEGVSVFSLSSTIPLTKGKYILSGGNSSVWVSIDLYKKNTFVRNLRDTGSNLKIDNSDFTYDRGFINLGVPKGTTVENVTINPQLEVGTAVTPYSYYSPLSQLRLFRYGNNLVNIPDTTVTQTNGYYGYQIYNSTTILNQFNRLAGQTVYFSAVSNNTKFIPEIVIYNSGTAISATNGKNLTIPQGVKITQIDIRNRSDSADYNNVETTVSNILISLESNTKYEDYQFTEFTPNELGEVKNITALPNGTTLLTNNKNVNIDCTYSKDINKAFEELTQSILSLGGNI